MRSLKHGRMKRDEPLSPSHHAFRATTPSAHEDSARKFRLDIAAVIDWSLPGLDPHLAKVLEAAAAKGITQDRSMQTARFKDAGMLG